VTYLTIKVIKGNPYLYEVRSEREGDRVRQVFVKYLGRADKADMASLQTTARERIIEEPVAMPTTEAVTPTELEPSTPIRVGQLSKQYGLDIEITEGTEGGEYSGGTVYVGDKTTPTKAFAANWVDENAPDFITSKHYPKNVTSEAHEVAHGLFSRNPEAGHYALSEFKTLGVPDKVAFESLVDTAGLYLLEPDSITNPQIKKAVAEWVNKVSEPEVAPTPEEIEPAIEPEVKPEVEITKKEPWEMTTQEWDETLKARRKSAIEEWNKQGSKGFPPSTGVPITEIAPLAERAGYVLPRDAEKVLAIPYHKLQVEAALYEGKLVPSGVLKDYPDLAPTPEAIEAPIEPEILATPEEVAPVEATEYTRISGLTAQLKGLLNEDSKAKSISKLEDFINKNDLTEEQIIGLDEIETYIDEYRGIERAGLSPEEYVDEKASAFEALSDVVEALEVSEELSQPIREAVTLPVAPVIAPEERLKAIEFGTVEVSLDIKDDFSDPMTLREMAGKLEDGLYTAGDNYVYSVVDGKATVLPEYREQYDFKTGETTFTKRPLTPEDITKVPIFHGTQADVKLEELTVERSGQNFPGIGNELDGIYFTTIPSTAKFFGSIGRQPPPNIIEAKISPDANVVRFKETGGKSTAELLEEGVDVVLRGAKGGDFEEVIILNPKVLHKPSPPSPSVETLESEPTPTPEVVTPTPEKEDKSLMARYAERKISPRTGEDTDYITEYRFVRQPENAGAEWMGNEWGIERTLTVGDEERSRELIETAMTKEKLVKLMPHESSYKEAEKYGIAKKEYERIETEKATREEVERVEREKESEAQSYYEERLKELGTYKNVKRGTIEIATFPEGKIGKPKVMESVEGFDVGNGIGVAIHGEGKYKSYTVTHLNTGLALGHHWDKPKEAIALARAEAELADWSKYESEKDVPKPIMDKAASLVRGFTQHQLEPPISEVAPIPEAVEAPIGAGVIPTPEEPKKTEIEPTKTEVTWDSTLSPKAKQHINDILSNLPTDIQSRIKEIRINPYLRGANAEWNSTQKSIQFSSVRQAEKVTPETIYHEIGHTEFDNLVETNRNILDTYAKKMGVTFDWQALEKKAASYTHRPNEVTEAISNNPTYNRVQERFAREYSNAIIKGIPLPTESEVIPTPEEPEKIEPVKTEIKPDKEVKEDLATEEAPKPTEYRVREEKIDWLNRKFDKIQKVAKEVGATPPAYNILREEYVERIDEVGNKTGEFDKFYVINVEGEAPKIKGWEFIATLKPTESGNLINKVPTVIEDVPEIYRTSKPHCDYCNQPRHRTKSYIVKNEDTGEYKQIGSNCLAKFLGYSNPEKIARLAEWFANIDEDIDKEESEGGWSGGSNYRDLESYLAQVSAVIEQQGWVSKATSRATGKPSTVEEVDYQQSPHFKETTTHIRAIPTEGDFKKAREAMEFARSDKLTTDTDYKHNLKVALSSDYFPKDATGIVASILQFQDRDKEWEIQQKQRREEAEKRKEELQVSEFQGDIGERITRPVRVIRRTPVDSQFGVSYMYRMIDDDNNVYTWFSSNDVLEADKKYNITGRVKTHDTYKDTKQTVITRCKAQELEDAEPEVIPASQKPEPTEVAPPIPPKPIAGVTFEIEGGLVGDSTSLGGSFLSSMADDEFIVHTIKSTGKKRLTASDFKDAMDKIEEEARSQGASRINIMARKTESAIYKKAGFTYDSSRESWTKITPKVPPITPEPETGVKSLDDIFSEKHPQVDAFVFERPDSIRLKSISVAKELQREGRGTAYINDLISHADEVGKTITLSTGGRDFDFPKRKLIEYYKRFGFVENKGRNLDLRISDTMYRKPEEPARSAVTPKPEEPEKTEIQYSPNLDIRNVESLPRGTGAKYLITLKGQGDELVAKQWARVKPKTLQPDEVLIKMPPTTSEKVEIEPTQLPQEDTERKFIGVTKSTEPTQKRSPWRVAYEKEGEEYARHFSSKAKAIEYAKDKLSLDLNPRTLEPMLDIETDTHIISHKIIPYEKYYGISSVPTTWQTQKVTLKEYPDENIAAYQTKSGWLVSRIIDNERLADPAYKDKAGVGGYGYGTQEEAIQAFIEQKLQ